MEVYACIGTTSWIFWDHSTSSYQVSIEISLQNSRQTVRGTNLKFHLQGNKGKVEVGERRHTGQLIVKPLEEAASILYRAPQQKIALGKLLWSQRTAYRNSEVGQLIAFSGFLRERIYLYAWLPLQSPGGGSLHNSEELWWSFDDGQDFQQNKSPVAWGTSGFFQMLAALQTDQKKKIHPSCSRMYLQASLVGLGKL